MIIDALLSGASKCRRLWKDRLPFAMRKRHFLPTSVTDRDPSMRNRQDLSQLRVFLPQPLATGIARWYIVRRDWSDGAAHRVCRDPITKPPVTGRVVIDALIDRPTTRRLSQPSAVCYLRLEETRKTKRKGTS
jgi:hypothetical protein